MSKYVFPLDLNYLQNIRFLCALLEIDKDISVPLTFKSTMSFLNNYFNYDVTYDTENLKKPDFIDFNHQKPYIKYKNITKPLVFPKKLIDFCNKPVSKIYDFTFTGIKTQNRAEILNKWLEKYTGKNISLKNKNRFEFDKSFIKFSKNGRIFPHKAMDKNYYKTLMHSKFVLCPNGDFVWTYRFFEAVMCNAIPVIEEYCDIYKDFVFYTMDSSPKTLKYDKKIIKHNQKILIKNFTFNKS